MKSYGSVFILLLSVALVAQSETSPQKHYTTEYIPSGSIKIDGRLDDSAWERVPWGGGDFRVYTPNEGEQPTENTRFKLLFDDQNLYVGIRAYDAEPDKIVRRMTRRDRFDGDWLEINIDSNHDRQTAFSFNINAAGVKGDEFVSNNGDDWDSSWDPVWFVGTSIDAEGWVAEMRIPFSQLRFNSSENHVWGLQFIRRFFRKNERSSWIFIPRNSTGWVHQFGELHGITGVGAQRQVELLPYTVARQESFPKEAGNPFATGSNSELSLGLDGKVGLSSDITLDLTVNPDFGQVEADPSEVNLSAFETFFQEKRPFFIEGRNILEYNVTDAAWGGSYSSDRLFYSRRIGRRPHFSPETSDTVFADVPVNSSILGAAKITGKTNNGWSLGILESITDSEEAVMDSLGARRKTTVEPLTNYVVGRIQKDMNRSKTIVGAMFTAVNRNINSNLNTLHTSAYTAGVDLQHNIRNKTYYLNGNFIFSNVRGDKAAITETQTSSARYYQRPDADHVRVDSSRTSLSGHGGTITFGRRGKLKFQNGLTWRSPGLELNDIGYLRSADEINQWTWVGYYISKPFGIFNSVGINANTRNTWDFAGDRLESLLNTNGNVQFRNQWQAGASLTHTFEIKSNSALRGGPALRMPGNTTFNIWVNSDQRRKIQAEFRTWQQWGREDVYRGSEYWGGMSFQPANNFSFSVNAFYNTRKDQLQYVDTIDDRYLFGAIDQKTAGITLRINYSITPELSFEYYGSPFVSAGSYRDYKRILAPDAARYRDRFISYDEDRLRYDPDEEAYRIDESGDGQGDFSIDDPAFNFREFNSNLVVRWEYSPGSTLFLVWSQGRSSNVNDGRFSFGNDMEALFREASNNVLLLKFNHWFSL